MRACSHRWFKGWPTYTKAAAAVVLLAGSLTAQPPDGQDEPEPPGPVLDLPLLRGARIELQVDPPDAPRRSSSNSQPELDLSAPLANLFAKAEEAVGRNDWKLAVDSLQRIVEDPEGAWILRPNGRADGDLIYDSAAKEAVRRIAQLPPDGLRAYRTLHDGVAKGLFERARAAHDVPAMRLFVDRYLLTGSGDDASDLLASWALDAGRPVEALAVLTNLSELVTDQDVSPGLIAGKLAAAYAWLGRNDDARAVLAAYRQSHTAEAAAWLLGAPIDDPSSVLGRRSATATGASTALLLKPALLDPAPWQFQLPGVTENFWPAAPDAADPDVPAEFPKNQLILESGRLFVRTQRGCVALDAEDLALVWQASSGSIASRRSTQPVENTVVVRQRRNAQGQNSRPVPQIEPIFASLSAACGLVFTIDPAARRNEQSAGVFGGILPQTSSPDAAHRLTAFDAATGLTLWQQPGTDPDDALRDVRFRAMPIEVNGNLWTVFLRRDGLFVAVIDPKDGALLRTVPLCPSVLELWESRRLLQGVASDGMVYIPSGHGMLFALDAARITPRWAVGWFDYDEGGRGSCAPIARCGLVIDPAEHSELAAFSAINGSRVWSLPVSLKAHIIGADDRNMWLQDGDGVARVSLSDGVVSWHRKLDAPSTGRAALFGGVIYVPTLYSLLCLSADGGEELAREVMPQSQAPLGNLLCTEEGLFSVDPVLVRKFPDIERAYPRTLAQYETNPRDASAAVRLAQLELLRRQPDRAYEVLKPVPHPTDERWAGRLAHARVEALLAMASDSTPLDRRIAVLQDAVRTAATSSDRIRCGLALSDHLATTGNASAAFETLSALGVSSDADEPMITMERVRAPARFELARRLRALSNELSPADVARLGDAVLAAIRQAADKLAGGVGVPEARTRLRAIADLHTIGAANQHALAALADWELERARYEQAEQLLLECARAPGGSIVSTTALASLHELYALPAVNLAGGTASPAGAGLSGKTAWTIESGAEARLPRIVRFLESDSAALTDRVVLYGQEDLVSCRSSTDGRLLWQAQLRLPEGVSDEDRRARNTTSTPRYAVADGQVAVFSGVDGLFAVGLVTGRRLWAVPREGLSSADEASVGYQAIAAHEGMLAAMPRPGRLTLMKMLDGSTVWEHDLRGESIARVWMHDRTIVTADAAGCRIHFFDRADGRLLKRALFQQGPQPPYTPPVISGGLIVGSNMVGQPDGLTGLDLASGEAVWTSALEKPAAHLFPVKEGFVGMAMLGGDVRVIEAATGRVILDSRVPGATVVTDGAMNDAVLIVRYTEVERGVRHPTVVGLDVVTGQVLWHRSGFAAVERWDQPVRMIDGLLLAVMQGDESEGRHDQPPLSVVMIDAKSGENRGAEVKFPPVPARQVIYDDWGAWPGIVLMGGPDHIRALATDSYPTPGGGF